VHSGNGAHSSQSLVVDTIIDGLSKNKYKQMRKTALRTISTKRGAEGIHIMAPLRQKAKDLLIGKSDKRIKALKATIKTMNKHKSVIDEHIHDHIALHTTGYCTVITNAFTFPVTYPKSDILASLCYVLVIKDKSADDKRAQIHKKINDTGPGGGVVGITKQYNEWKNQISKYEKELDIESEIQQRTTGAIDDIVDETVHTGNSDEEGNDDDNDTDVDMEVDADVDMELDE